MREIENTERQFYSPKELAKALSVSYPSVVQYLQEGRIKGIRYGSLWRIPVAEFNRVLSEGIPPTEEAAA